VYKFAVRKMAEAAVTVLERNGLHGDELDCFIPHQANKRIIQATAERLGLAEERVVINIDRFGNTTQNDTAGDGNCNGGRRLKKGDIVLLASVGAALQLCDAVALGDLGKLSAVCSKKATGNLKT